MAFNFVNPLFNSLNLYQPQEMRLLRLQIKIKIIFQRIGGIEDTTPIEIQSSPDEKVSTIIEKYRNISSDLAPNKKFIFKDKELNPSLFLSEAGITDYSVIFVVKFEKIPDNI